MNKKITLLIICITVTSIISSYIYAWTGTGPDIGTIVLYSDSSDTFISFSIENCGTNGVKYRYKLSNNPAYSYVTECSENLNELNFEWCGEWSGSGSKKPRSEDTYGTISYPAGNVCQPATQTCDKPSNLYNSKLNSGQAQGQAGSGPVLPLPCSVGSVAVFYTQVKNNILSENAPFTASRWFPVKTQPNVDKDVLQFSYWGYYGWTSDMESQFQCKCASGTDASKFDGAYADVDDSTCSSYNNLIAQEGNCKCYTKSEGGKTKFCCKDCPESYEDFDGTGGVPGNFIYVPVVIPDNPTFLGGCGEHYYCWPGSDAPCLDVEEADPRSCPSGSTIIKTSECPRCCLSSSDTNYKAGLEFCNNPCNCVIDLYFKSGDIGTYDDPHESYSSEYCMAATCVGVLSGTTCNKDDSCWNSLSGNKGKRCTNVWDAGCPTTTSTTTTTIPPPANPQCDSMVCSRDQATEVLDGPYLCCKDAATNFLFNCQACPQTSLSKTEYNTWGCITNNQGYGSCCGDPECKTGETLCCKGVDSGKYCVDCYDCWDCGANGGFSGHGICGEHSGKIQCLGGAHGSVPYCGDYKCEGECGKFVPNGRKCYGPINYLAFEGGKNCGSSTWVCEMDCGYCCIIPSPFGGCII